MAQAADAKPTPGSAKTSDFDDVPARESSLFLIDGSSLAYRSFFALPQEIATSDGRPTNALLGFANMLIKLVSDYDPETVIVAWDVGGETERKKAFAEYKSQRPEMPALLSEQWPHFKPLVEAFGFTNISMQGYEADDVIGTLARQASERGIRTSIVTYDRDAMQLVEGGVTVMMTTKGVSEVAAFTPERVYLRYAVRPSQIADFIALRGDTSDNIPGVPGIGDKTAAQLLAEHGTLDAILESLDTITAKKRRENLEAHADQARMSRELATIVCDLPLEIDLDEVHAAPPDRSRLVEMFQTLEFRSLTRRVQELDLEGAPGSRRTAAGGAGDGAGDAEGDAGGDADAGAGDAPEPGGELVTARQVSVHELGSLLDAAPDQGRDVPVIVEAIGGDAPDGSVAAAVVVEEGMPDGGEPQRWVAIVTGPVRPLAEALQGRRVTTFDYKGLPALLTRRGTDGERCCRLADDLLLAAYLIQPGRRQYLLGELQAEAALRARVALASGSDELAALAARAWHVEALLADQLEKLESLGMLELYRDVELPTIDVLLHMQGVGISLDEYRMGEIAAKVSDQVDELVERAHELAGHEFNLGSPQQLATVLFEELELPAQRKGKTGWSTDARVLRDLRDLHPLVPVIEQWRELSKLRSTYLDTLPGLVDPKTHRLHTTFSQVTAATGRLSSVHPNLQNIPVPRRRGAGTKAGVVRTDWGAASA